MTVFARFWKWVRQAGAKEPPLTEEEASSLREAFSVRYHSFKLLLAANNKALEIMSEMEEAQRGIRPFGMSFVRASSTAVSVNVFRIVQNLDHLAPGKYAELFDRFKAIQADIRAVLSRGKPPAEGRLVIPLEEVDKDLSDQTGSKMASLGEAARALKIRTPPGFVVTAHAFRRFLAFSDLQPEIDRRIQASEASAMDELYALSADLQQLIIRSPLPPDLAEEMAAAYSRLEAATEKGVRVSLRSSALGEDSHGTSFAGQYRSRLNVSPDSIPAVYKEILASKYSLEAIAYRKNRGIPDEDVAMCVGCMAMVPGVAGGVTYSRNPMDIRDDSILIHSVWGLPKSVVDGTIAPDVFVLSRTPSLSLVKKDIAQKERAFVCYPEEGVCRLSLTGEKSGEPSLTDAQALALGEMALLIEDYFGAPQDVEWALTGDGEVHLLQCRPLIQVHRPVDQGRKAGAPGAGVLSEGTAAASPGVASGTVFVVERESDLLRFPDGAVLVAAEARPRLAALLERAAAVVTESGSLAGHLANVAREFGVPALFGVPDAVGLLSDAGVVTVDADGGRVYRGRVEDLLKETGPRKSLMEGSPVLATLKEAVQRIVPLYLVDPDAPEFKPSHCRTLHDITRFCHEKSVREMFDFGKEHHFSERAANQLVCRVPMQWWIINLDDAFREDAPGRFVDLSNIVSIPMLALWDGITSVPWKGPPPVDTRGFMSVLMEATTNPDLVPSMPSGYANRNYFMLSRHFMSLQSRFGFHFTSVEALVGDRAGENYVSFQFKGGAADLARKIRRARFVGKILEDAAFRVQIKEDGLFARAEGLPKEAMEEKLRILGYLLIHTRQLDMVMANDASSRHYHEVITRDIETVLKPMGKMMQA